MQINYVRRISQTFFLVLFLWFCLVSSFGLHWWQLRGWPVNWFLQLDPLVALATVLTTHSLYAGLSWAIATIVLTILLGRFFCGWMCPFGALHHFFGFLGKLGKPLSQKIEINQYHGAQVIKYYLLIFLFAAASGGLLAHSLRAVLGHETAVGSVLAMSVSIGLFSFLRRSSVKSFNTVTLVLLLVCLCTLAAFLLSLDHMVATSLQTGLLDPIPLMHRSVNLIVLPLLDASTNAVFTRQRLFEGSWLIATIFFSAILLNFRIPRFYCRFVCPLGALYGFIGRYALWRIGKRHTTCTDCKLCEAGCEGSCEPTGRIRLHECVLCMNCLDDCRHGAIMYTTHASTSGEAAGPDLSRRGALITLLSGLAAVPVVRLSGSTALNWNARLVRPPGALSEESFLTRCIKCGQCMRICPTNIIQPAGLEGGFEGLWTPILNFRIGSSGCQQNCIACGYICPTAAIRPLTLDEKLGRNSYANSGPIRMGTAFVDRGRCLPWAMDKPCIVCQENCPVSPKAIFVREYFSSVREGQFTAGRVDMPCIEITGRSLKPGRFATGDYYLKTESKGKASRWRIIENTEQTLVVDSATASVDLLQEGDQIEIEVRLLRPQVDLERCTGCGVCEHECPVSGQRAIRITAENESRTSRHSLLL